MDGDDASIYGDAWAPFYDSIYPAPAPEQIEFLISRAQGGPVLELAIGSGRVALPLPDQIDSMATAAGLNLVERYEGYDETPFTDVSPRHISVYRNGLSR